MSHLTKQLLTLCVVTWIPARVAYAQGFDLAAPGAVALGRASAVVGSDDTPLALANNPARLAFQRTAITGAANLIVSDVCFARWDLNNGPQQTMCNQAKLAESASAAVTVRLRPDLALGFGLVAPVAVGHVRFGGDVPPEESPTRYAVVESRTLAAFPTLGLGYAPSPMLRLGAAFSWGFAKIDNVSYAYAGLDSDMRTRVRASDPFVPRVAVGASIGPFRGFEIASVFTYTSDFGARGSAQFDGDVHLSPTSTVPVHQTVHGVSLSVPQTQQVVLAMRYALALDAAEGAPPRDRLSSERFDIEADFAIVSSDRVDDFVLRFPTDATLDAGGVVTELPDTQVIPHRWRRQYVIRVGGDVTIVPSRFSMRTGFAYETDGASDAYRNIDFTPFERFTFSLGATVRIGQVDVSLAYAHLYQPMQFVAPSEARLERPLGGLANPATDAQVINAGVYRTGYDLVALDFTCRFGRAP